MTTINPHDKFFKETFSKKEEVIDLLTNRMPENIIKKLDINTLQLEKDSYVNEELQENFSDLVYNCTYNGKEQIKISLLLEHKSSQPKYPHLQLLKYLLNIWESNFKQNKDLVPVIPIILYHGTKGWETKEFRSYFKGIDSDIARFLPEFDYLVTDLTVYSDEEIKNLFHTLTVQISLLVMKNIFDDIELERKLRKILSDIGPLLEKEKGTNFLISILKYIFESTDIDNTKIVQNISTIHKKGGELAMTTAEKLKQEGLQEGLKKGKQEGMVITQKETITKLYQKAHLTINEIANYLEIDKEFVKTTLKEKGLDQ